MLTLERHTTGLCLLLVMSACGEAPRSLPTAPTVQNISDPAVSTFTLSGVITERFSGRPVQGARVWVEPISHAQVRSWPPAGLRTTPSDGAGRYTISGLPSLGPVWVSTAQTWGDAFSAPYVHQCVTTVTVESNATLNVTVSSTTDLVVLNASTGPAPAHSRIVSGTVFEITPDGRQPVGNVWVGWEASGSGDLMAETRTDAAGHYRLCGLPRERISLSAAPEYGNVVYATVDPGSDASVDIEIVPKTRIRRLR
jgi:hypothetical protein